MFSERSSGPAAGPFWTGDRIAGAVLVAIAAAVAIETRTLPFGSLGRPGPGLAPLLYALILAALGVAIALGPGGARLAAPGWGETRYALLVLGAGAFAAAAIDRLGYRLTMLAVLIFLLGAVERRPPLAVTLVSVGLSFGSYFCFWNLLRVPLPTGPFGL